MAIGEELNKKIGPLSGKAWLLTGLGVGAAYYIYSRIKGSSSLPASATGVSTAGTSIPGNTVTSGAVTSSTPVFSTLSDWMNSAISSMSNGGLNAQDAFNGVNDWLNGSCVTQDVYNALGGVITSQGLPPGYSTSTPPLTVCASSTTSSSGGSSTTSTTTTTGSTTPTTGSTTSSVTAPIKAAVSKVSQVISQTTGLPMAGVTVQNGTTMINGAPAQITNPAAPGFNIYQPLTAAQAQTAYENDLSSLLAAGYTPQKAQELAKAATSNVG